MKVKIAAGLPVLWSYYCTTLWCVQYPSPKAKSWADVNLKLTQLLSAHFWGPMHAIAKLKLLGHIFESIWKVQEARTRARVIVLWRVCKVKACFAIEIDQHVHRIDLWWARYSITSWLPSTDWHIHWTSHLPPERPDRFTIFTSWNLGLASICTSLSCFLNLEGKLKIFYVYC